MSSVSLSGWSHSCIQQSSSSKLDACAVRPYAALHAQEKVTGFETGWFRGTRNSLLFPLSVKEASNSVQHEQCCCNEATIHLASELRPPRAATDDHGLRGPVTLFFWHTNTKLTQSSWSNLSLEVVLFKHSWPNGKAVRRTRVHPSVRWCVTQGQRVNDLSNFYQNRYRNSLREVYRASILWKSVQGHSFFALSA